MSNLSRHLPAALGLSCAGALALAALSARSQTPATSAVAAASASSTAAATASASASASTSGSAAPAAAKNVLRGADIPAAASDMPKDKKDWDPAKVVSPNVGSSDYCVFKLLREWLRIECEPRIGGALLAGEPADVKIWSWGDLAALFTNDLGARSRWPNTVIVLPLRRGDAKIFSLALVDQGYEWVGPGNAERISILWREGADDPVLVVGQGR